MNTGVDGWDSAGSTDVGLVRRLNEDSFLNRPHLGFWVVADGMGGHDCGDVASQMLCTELDKLSYDENLPSAVDLIDNKVLEVNRELRSLALARHAESVIGSTLIALVARGRYAVCLWAGDSRLYRFRGSLLARLSDDHSLVEESQPGLYDGGAVHANVITRAVGAYEELILDVDAFELIDGDRFLLCSDGLNKELTDDEIAQLMAKGSAQDCSRALIEKALNAGGTDNVTAIVADYRPGSEQ